MTRVKKITLSALVAFALAAGGLTLAHQPPPTEPDPVASSAGGRAKIARESASLPAVLNEAQQVAVNPQIVLEPRPH